jgi:hypothetical protein
MAWQSFAALRLGVLAFMWVVGFNESVRFDPSVSTILPRSSGFDFVRV